MQYPNVQIYIDDIAVCYKFFTLKCTRNHLVLFGNKVKASLTNHKKTSFSSVWPLKMAKITGFLFKMRMICAELNRTGRIYDIIGHPEVGLRLDPCDTSNSNYATFLKIF